MVSCDQHVQEQLLDDYQYITNESAPEIVVQQYGKVHDSYA